MITIIGLGPGDIDRVPKPVMQLLTDPNKTVIVRTREHPAARELAETRNVVFCDDLYESSDTFESVYSAIADRVIEAARSTEVVYGVPGSALIGEFAVRHILDRCDSVEVIAGESFVDAILAHLGYDPLDRGLQILNGHDLPDPLILDKPTIIAHLDKPEILADVVATIDQVVPDGTVVTTFRGLGASDEMVVITDLVEVDPGMAGFRTSLFLDCEPGGIVGAVTTMRLLRETCPWDRVQTHQSLVKNLVEESYELIDAIGRLSDPEDLVRYASVEDELGDVLLQVLFHSAIARQRGVFDFDDVAEVLRQKLVRRHPHVFGEVTAESADEVKANWDEIKARERGDEGTRSALDGIPTSLPALQVASKIQNRAAKVGFDWVEAAEVVPKVTEELSELIAAMKGEGDVPAELGDLLFSIVNLSRHLAVDPELALRQAVTRFEKRFRHMEAAGPLLGLDLDELNERWEAAKRL